MSGIGADPAGAIAANPRSYIWASFVLGILLLAPISAILTLNINNVPQVYLPTNAPAVVIDREIRQVFPNDQGLAFILEPPALYSDDFIRSLDQVTHTLESNPAIQKVFSVTSQDHIEANESGLSIDPLLDVTQLERWNEDQRRYRVDSDALSRGVLTAREGEAFALVVIPVDIENSFDRMTLQAMVHRVIEKNGLGANSTAEAGLITTDVEQTREFLRQLAIFMPLTVLLGILLIWVLFRRVLAVLLSLVSIGATVGPTVALYSVFDLPFNLVSSILPPLLCALTIAALVHLFTGVKLASNRGLVGAHRVKTALSHVNRPGFYSAATTMAGFGSLGFSEIRPISHLGVVTAAGVLLIYVVAYHLIPPMVVRWDRRDWPSQRGKLVGIDRVIRRTYQTGIRYPKQTLLGALLLLALGSPFIGKIVVETNLLEFFASDHQVRLDTERYERLFAGTGSLDIFLTTSELEGLVTPSALEWMHDFQQWAESQNEVDVSRSVVNFIEEMHWAFNGGLKEYRRIPENPAIISEYLFTYSGTDLYDFLDQDFSTARIHLNLNVHGSSQIDQVLNQVNQYLTDHPHDDIDWKIAGLGRMFSDQVALLIDGQIKSIIGAIGIIFLLMLLEWRSFVDTLVCLIPNFAPVLMIFVVMGVFGIWLDVATAMIASVAVGIAIDDTIHLFHGFISRVRIGISPVVALARTYDSAGRAVMTTTIILCAQFGLLTLSSFVPIQHFGLLASAGMFAALVFDLLLLPAILMLVYGRRNVKHHRQGDSGNQHSIATGS